MARRILNMRSAKSMVKSFGYVLVLVTMCYASFIPRINGVPVVGILFTALVVSFAVEVFFMALQEVLMDTASVKKMMEALLDVMRGRL